MNVRAIAQTSPTQTTMLREMPNPHVESWRELIQVRWSVDILPRERKIDDASHHLRLLIDVSEVGVPIDDHVRLRHKKRNNR